MVGKGDDDTAGLAFQVYQMEYNRAWAEIFARFESQRLAFTVLIAGFGALVSLEKLSVYLSELTAWMPLFASALGYIFFDNELQIWRIARYMRDQLAPDVRQIVKNPRVLGLDAYESPWKLPGKTAFPLSVGRWVLFVVPALCSVVAAWPVFFRHGWWGWVLLLLDLTATALLALGVCAAVVEQRRWTIVKCEAEQTR